MALALYGAGGFGREVAPLAADAVFVSDDAGEIGRVINGLPVIDFDALTSPRHRARKVVIAIAEPRARQTIAERCAAAGLEFGSVIAASHRSLINVQIAEGAILCDHTLCTADVRIGRHFHGNLYSYVAHDCVIGDFVTFAPRVSCNGRVIIEDNVYVGTNACLREGRKDHPLVIGRGAVIGMGAVVTKSVAPGAVVVGNPARPLTSS